jgi:hypothetical protein
MIQKNGLSRTRVTSKKNGVMKEDANEHSSSRKTQRLQMNERIFKIQDE